MGTGRLRFIDQILLLNLVLLFFSSVANAEVGIYPKILNQNEIKAHFIQFRNIVAEQEAREFTFTIDDDTGQRICDECGTDTASEVIVSYPPKSNQVCIDWQYVSFPSSGCFTLVRTGDRYFKLDKVESSISIDYKVSAQPKLAADILAAKKNKKFAHYRAILVDLSLAKPKIEPLWSAIKFSLTNRGWVIESDDHPKFIIAKLTKSQKKYKIKIEYREPWLAMSFVEGYHASKNGWLRNLEKDVLKYLMAQ